MHMKHNEILYAVIGVLAGVVFTMLFIFKTGDVRHGKMMNMMGMKMQKEKSMPMMHQMPGGSSMSMDGMVSALEGKTGDEFDEAFVTLMIEHHQGAVDMAELSAENAKHDEVKDLSKDIITTQTKEVDMMKAWLKQWGY